MAITTRTLNPLPFRDLEPKRFEDLVRQLAYEFKNWRRLEATGRSGTDDGFDARGLEITDDHQSTYDSESEIDDERANDSVDRLWLIQCKRESQIGPTKLLTYLHEISIAPEERLYGIVFAAACDFSKKTRDAMAQWCRENGVDEWHIWGRGELEDMLFQPKFDHLLFAYFGISLSIRRRARLTDLRHQVAIKRKLKKFIDSQGDGLVLLRDIEDKFYPEISANGDKPRFRVRQVDSLTAYGLQLKLSMREAWLSIDGSEWDVALESYGNAHSFHNDRWNRPTKSEKLINELARDSWEQFPENEKAWLYVDGLIPYDRIAFIDDIGDDEFSGPHLFVIGWDEGYPLARYYLETVAYREDRIINVGPDAPGRIIKFPAETREIKREYSGY